MPMTNSNDRYSRQKDIIPADRIVMYPITVIGIGSIGRQVAIQAAAIGVRSLKLIDFDVVEEANIP